MPDVSLDALMPLSFARGIIRLLLGWLLARLLLTLIQPFLVKHFERQQQILTEQLIFWLLMMLLFVVNVLNQTGYELSVLLGAAGVLSVVVGFTAKIAAANSISGLFVVGTRGVSSNDNVKVDEYTGEVVSIDWRSINFRTFERLLVRIANEACITLVATNLSKFSISRLDMQVRIAHSDAIGCSRSVLLQAAAVSPQCLENPKPLIIMRGFGETSIDRQCSVWTQRENFFNMRNGLQEGIKNAVDAADIQLPFFKQTLLFVEQPPPLPIHIMTPSSVNTSQST
jgi:small-conductance mechanosensitive channel